MSESSASDSAILMPAQGAPWSFDELATNRGEAAPQYRDLWDRLLISIPNVEHGGREMPVIGGSVDLDYLEPWNASSPSGGGIAHGYHVAPWTGKAAFGAYWSHPKAVIGDFSEITAVLVFHLGSTNQSAVIVSSNQSNGNNGWRLALNSSQGLNFTLGGVDDYSLGITLTLGRWYVIAWAFSAKDSFVRGAIQELDGRDRKAFSVSVGTMIGGAETIAVGGTKGLNLAFSQNDTAWSGVALFDGFDYEIAEALLADPHSWKRRDSTSKVVAFDDVVVGNVDFDGAASSTTAADGDLGIVKSFCDFDGAATSSTVCDGDLNAFGAPVDVDGPATTGTTADGDLDVVKSVVDFDGAAVSGTAADGDLLSSGSTADFDGTATTTTTGDGDLTVALKVDFDGAASTGTLAAGELAATGGIEFLPGQLMSRAIVNVGVARQIVDIPMARTVNR